MRESGAKTACKWGWDGDFCIFCFNLGFIGDFLPLWFTKESYLEYAAQMMDAGYMATMEGLLTWPVFGIIVLSILVGSILGALLGMKLMRKHFVKAGLAQ